MTEDSDIQMGLHVIIVLCLIVIAMSSYKSAYCSTSYFNDAEKAALPFAAERSDRFIGSGEAPAFFNLGSVEQTNELLQAAAREKVTETYTPKPHMEHYSAQPSFVKPVDFTDIESFAGTGM